MPYQPQATAPRSRAGRLEGISVDQARALEDLADLAGDEWAIDCAGFTLLELLLVIALLSVTAGIMVQALLLVPYLRAAGVPEGLVYSFPVTTRGGDWEIVQGLEIDDFSRGKMDATAQELIEERDAVKELGLI